MGADDSPGGLAVTLGPWGEVSMGGLAAVHPILGADKGHVSGSPHSLEGRGNILGALGWVNLGFSSPRMGTRSA